MIVILYVISSDRERVAALLKVRSAHLFLLNGCECPLMGRFDEGKRHHLVLVV